jgi:hypothetical protein
LQVGTGTEISGPGVQAVRREEDGWLVEVEAAVASDALELRWHLQKLREDDEKVSKKPDNHVDDEKIKQNCLGLRASSLPESDLPA